MKVRNGCTSTYARGELSGQSKMLRMRSRSREGRYVWVVRRKVQLREKTTSSKKMADLQSESITQAQRRAQEVSL